MVINASRCLLKFPLATNNSCNYRPTSVKMIAPEILFGGIDRPRRRIAPTLLY